ncbi:endonuclease/exonuclease/phosphatase family protein [Catellatospora bangladeshensis]|uniref:endonuclease/exonuclease/phosphatase family protein n=1 Tax=Catellatospora bangladeshensis TaxID=310355 RepID=UPI0036231C9A
MWAYGLVWVLPVLLFQVHYDMPLPFGNRWLLIVLAVLVGLAGMGRRPDHPGGWRVDLRGLAARPAPVAGAVALALAVPLLMHLTRPDDGTVTVSPTGVTVLSWNVKYGRDDATGQADPDRLAKVIRALDPDVVVLQEVSRGWAIGGGVDVAEYLSRELRMPFWWSPAADGQFGNLLLTRLPVSDVRTGRLPYGQGPMHRSYLKATVQLAFGRSMDVVTAHLTHRKPNTPTRLAQIDTLLDQADRARPTVVAGDFNFWPSWPETRSFTNAGWTSAQDVTGHGDAWTSPRTSPPTGWTGSSAPRRWPSPTSGLSPGSPPPPATTSRSSPPSPSASLDPPVLKPLARPQFRGKCTKRHAIPALSPKLRLAVRGRPGVGGVG